MVNLYDQESNELIGIITDEQLQFLQAQMEEESFEDRDYAITPMTIEFLAGRGADPQLLDLLGRALGSRQEVLVRWSRS